MIHPPHLTLDAIVAATTCGASLAFLVFVTLYSIARLLVDLTLQPRERGEGRRDLQPEKAHRLTTAAASGSFSGSSPPQTSRRSGGSGHSLRQLPMVLATPRKVSPPSKPFSRNKRDVTYRYR
jgi:hypothetical protein